MDPLRYYGNYVPAVRGLCDQMYEHHNSGTSRRIAYHNHAVSLIENMMSLSQAEEGGPGNLDEMDDFDQLFGQLASRYEQRQQQPNSEAEPLAGMAFDDLTIDLSDMSNIESHSLQIPTVTTTPPDNINQRPANTTSDVQPNPEHPTPDHHEQDEPEPQKPTEADSRCDLCGYRPRGDPQWFKGSMAKHKKLMHSTAPPKIYKCPFPGCASQYKNRPDNLRQHQIEKGHFVGGEEGGGATSRRPSKRKKVAVEGE